MQFKTILLPDSFLTKIENRMTKQKYNIYKKRYANQVWVFLVNIEAAHSRHWPQKKSTICYQTWPNLQQRRFRHSNKNLNYFLMGSLESKFVLELNGSTHSAKTFTRNMRMFVWWTQHYRGNTFSLYYACLHCPLVRREEGVMQKSRDTHWQVQITGITGASVHCKTQSTLKKSSK